MFSDSLPIILRIAPDNWVANMYGCDTVDEFRKYVGNTFMGMVHPEDRERIEKEIWSQVEGNKWRLDYIHGCFLVRLIYG